MNEWRPIETAPKDEGRQILTFRAGKNSVHWMGPWYQTSFWSDQHQLWVGWPRDEKPTHWMPLPEPPPETVHVYAASGRCICPTCSPELWRHATRC